MANYRNKYSNEEILNQLRAHYKRNGKITKKIFDSDKTVCSTITVNKKFGSWKKALKMLDLEKEYRVTYSDEEILNQLRAHYKRNPNMTRASFQKDKTVCSSSIEYTRFGSGEKALVKAGILETRRKMKEKAKSEKNKRKTKKNFALDKKELLGRMYECPQKRELIYTKSELVGKYRRLRKKEKYIKTEIEMEDFCKETSIDSKLIIENFGNWEKFCEISKPLSCNKKW